MGHDYSSKVNGRDPSRVNLATGPKAYLPKTEEAKGKRIPFTAK